MLCPSFHFIQIHLFHLFVPCRILYKNETVLFTVINYSVSLRHRGDCSIAHFSLHPSFFPPLPWSTE